MNVSGFRSKHPVEVDLRLGQQAVELPGEGRSRASFGEAVDPPRSQCCAGSPRTCCRGCPGRPPVSAFLKTPTRSGRSGSLVLLAAFRLDDLGCVGPSPSPVVLAAACGRAARRREPGSTSGSALTFTPSGGTRSRTWMRLTQPQAAHVDPDRVRNRIGRQVTSTARTGCSRMPFADAGRRAAQFEIDLGLDRLIRAHAGEVEMDDFLAEVIPLNIADDHRLGRPIHAQLGEVGRLLIISQTDARASEIGKGSCLCP